MLIGRFWKQDTVYISDKDIDDCNFDTDDDWSSSDDDEELSLAYMLEFYKFFFEMLSQEFLDCVNAAYKDNELSISQRIRVITLIPKEDANLKDLSNWRPITLLNIDYKIASKAIATRIEKVLPLLINPNQTGFVKGCYIGKNIHLLKDIFEQTKVQNIPGILLLLDFRKAFDTGMELYSENVRFI